MSETKLTPQKVRAILTKAGVRPPYPSRRHQSKGAALCAHGNGGVEIYAPVADDMARASAACEAAGFQVASGATRSFAVVRAKDGAA